jgi:hypothetical protein
MINSLRHNVFAAIQEYAKILNEFLDAINQRMINSSLNRIIGAFGRIL